MFTEILVPLDGSELAEQALPHAQRLATAMDATLHLAAVIELPAPVRTQGVGAPVNVYESVIAHQRRETATYLAQVGERVQRAIGRQVSVTVLEGYPPTALLDHARAAGIDLVVMTNHGQRGLTRWVLGSVADRIARASTVPVLLVPAEPEG